LSQAAIHVTSGSLNALHAPGRIEFIIVFYLSSRFLVIMLVDDNDAERSRAKNRAA